MNDKLTAEELEELEEIAEWLDNLYTRLEGSQIAFALHIGNEQYHQSLQNDLEQAAILGIQINRPMEHCGCLFEALNGTERPPIDYIIRARSEVNNLAIAIRQMAVDEHKAAKPKQRRQQPDHPITTWFKANGHKYDNKKLAVAAYADIHGGNKTQLYTQLDNQRNRLKP